ncbi:Fc.00g111330.m01.CDS01 [Cosmosporella sp. VM-42]
MYNLNDIPAQTFVDVVNGTKESFNSMSPYQYYDSLVKFSEAIKKGSPPFSIKLTGSDGIPAEIMHEIACILHHIPGGVKTAQAFSVAMWASASDMGHRPSTISLARMLIGGGAWGKMSQLNKIQTRFKQLVSEGRDSNVLTAEGELLYKEGKYDAAAKTLQRALRIDSPGFEWKPHCQLCLGKAFTKLQKHAEANDAFQASIESGALDADGELGQMFRSSDPEAAAQHLYTAATHGRPEFFRHLSEISLEDQADTADEKSRQSHQRWAMEWSKLADPSVPY